MFQHSEAFSFRSSPDNTKPEDDRYWNAIVNHGGTESAADGAKKMGLSLADHPRVCWTQRPIPDRAASQARVEAMLKLKKIDIAAHRSGTARTARA